MVSYVAAVLGTHRRMRRIMGYQQLWILEAKLQEIDSQQVVARERKRA